MHAVDVRRHTVLSPIGEKLAVYLYATTNGPWFRSINTPLREQLRCLLTSPQSFRCCATQSKNFLCMLAVYIGEIRIDDDFTSFVQQYRVGSVATWLAFSSSSIDAEQAAAGKFANVIFTI